MILVVGGIKGGVGKSTLAANLAVLAARDGRDVLLIDGDGQLSAGGNSAPPGARSLKLRPRRMINSGDGASLPLPPPYNTLSYPYCSIKPIGVEEWASEPGAFAAVVGLGSRGSVPVTGK